MFGMILITTVTALHVYVLWRIAGLPALRRRLSGNTLVITGAGLWLLFLLGRVIGHDNGGTFDALLELAGMTWMGVLLLLSVSFLAVDALTGFGMLLPRIAPQLREAGFAVGIALSLIALVQGARQPVVDTYEVSLPGLPSRLDNTVIVGLSDLHLGALRDGQWLETAASRVRAEKPDMIVLLGDIFEGHGLPPRELGAGLAGFTAPLGVWAVLGNHELHGREEVIVPLFQDSGIRVLRNERVQIRPGLALAGVDDLTDHRRTGSQADLVTPSLAGAAAGATILLSHTPWSADRAAKAGAGLMLCGHTHGGQIWPFGYLVKLFYPLLAGRYDVDTMTVIVSRGAGSWGPRMRLWEPGEIIKVTLRAKQQRR